MRYRDSGKGTLEDKEDKGDCLVYGIQLRIAICGSNSFLDSNLLKEKVGTTASVPQSPLITVALC
jgi:hypothetical protein